MIRSISLASILTLLLASCGQDPLLSSTTEKTPTVLGNPALESVAPDARIVDESTFNKMRSLNVEPVRVRHQYTFKNGEQLNYMSYEGNVINGDTMLGTLEDFGKYIQDYETKLATKSLLMEQGLHIARCPQRFLWGCVTPWEGISWPRDYGTTRVTIPVMPLTDFTPEEQGLIRSAMQEIQALVPALKFEERFDLRAIAFQKSASGCWSRLGYQNDGRTNLIPQQLNLGTGCMYKGIIQHEILHALGVAHEHMRPDRDNYLVMNTSNMKQLGLDNSWKYWSQDVLQNFTNSFDYGSLMMYPLYVYDTNFVYNVSLPFMTATQPVPVGVTVGQRNGLSTLDIAALNLRYPNY